MKTAILAAVMLCAGTASASALCHRCSPAGLQACIPSCCWLPPQCFGQRGPGRNYVPRKPRLLPHPGPRR
jgi:hypothetical protein